MTSNSRWHHAVKHINSSSNRVNQIFRRPYSHEISWLILWQLINQMIQYHIELFSGFSHT